ncbi:MAG: hypothetical protein Q3992_04185 [Bacteroides sp.]|nr:hypothetical protein [Bacteroides sp.]
MKRLSFWSKFVAVALVLSLSSCMLELGVYDDVRVGGVITPMTKTELLCRNGWIDRYVDRDGNRCVQTIEFFRDGTGVDIIRTELPNRRVVTKRNVFDWSWIGSGYVGLELRYGVNDYSYFEKVVIAKGLLSGYWDNSNQLVQYSPK